jgi:hypothetical protein
MISTIKFMDFLFWIDIKNKIGINHITTILGPILNILQPVFLYVAKYFYYRPDILTLKNGNLPVLILNFIYFIYFIFIYIDFLSNSKLTTSTSHGHLKWPWIKYSSSKYYLMLLAINIFYLFEFKYALALFLLTYFFFFISAKYFFYNPTELWCFFGSFIPLLMLFISIILC